MLKNRSGATALLLFILFSGPALAAPKVITTIAPIHSLVAYIMQGAGEPELLLKSTASPHDYHLRPSDMRSLSQPDIVFWIGPGFEAFLQKPLASNPQIAQLALTSIEGITLLPLREGGIWGSHDVSVSGSEHHEHDSGADPHIWLDPDNAIVFARAIQQALTAIDPEQAPVYQTNTERLVEQLNHLQREINEILLPVKNTPYIVFHDAYQYFEQRFELNALGSITLNPERRPGVRRVREIRERILTTQVRCVFSEPQFEPALIETLLEDSNARSAQLDPIGVGLTPGPDAYFQLLRQLAQTLRACLAE